MAAGDVKLYISEANSKDAVVGDGTGDHVQVDAWGAAREAAGTADTVGTLMGWILRNTATNDDCIISAGDTNAIEYINLHVHNGYLNCSLADGGSAAWDVEGDNLDVPPFEWHHVAVVQNGTAPVLYVDGVAIASTNDVSTDLTKWFAALNGIDNANIGMLDMNTSTSMDIDGAIADVRHYNTALTATEIKDIFEGRTISADAEEISQWIFGDDLLDTGAAGDSHDGTIGANIYLSRWNAVCSRLHLAYVAAADKIQIIPNTDGNYEVYHQEGA